MWACELCSERFRGALHLEVAGVSPHPSECDFLPVTRALCSESANLVYEFAPARCDLPDEVLGRGRPLSKREARDGDIEVWSSVVAFSEPLGRFDATYFALTTLGTAGFGDIHPVSQAARKIVFVQIVGDLLVLGVAVSRLEPASATVASESASR